MHIPFFVAFLAFVAVRATQEDETFTVTEMGDIAKGDVSGHQFQAEINQLMSLIVNSLYSNRDIFVRELISNAADALDKIRYVSVTDPSALSAEPNLEIKVKLDLENGLIQIRDTGIGMTQKELVNNLGSIAKSGTKDFVKKVSAGAQDLSQIGQFGVGFYSSFLVADRVTVVSKSNDDDQYIWESTMADDAAFSVAKDPRGNTLGRGTLVTLHIKEDASEYLSQTKLKGLIQHYTQFLTFPIKMLESHEETVQKPVEEKPETPAEDSAEPKEEGVEVVEEEEQIAEEPEPEKITVHEWVQVNAVQPLWTRKPADVTHEEYESFFASLDKSGGTPLNWSHFKAEGDVEFTALLYVPSAPPPGSTDIVNVASSVKLYVKRVFISDSFDEFFPAYLNFIKGIVDSDDLPLNVSRELLQQNRILKAIQKKLVRKIIALLQSIIEDPEKGQGFYENYHQFIKMGIVRDAANKGRLAKLLRFYSAKSPSKFISLDNYVEGLKEGQEEIYYLGGENKETLLNSPLLERLLKKGVDVLLFDSPMDEYVSLHLGQYESKYKLVDVGKEGLKLDENDKEKQTEYKKEFEPLTKYLKEILSKQVSSVDVSMRLSTSPCALVSTQWGMSANLERIMKAQALAEKQHLQGVGAKKVLEINPRHPIMKQLLEIVDKEEQTASTADIARMLYDSASLASGYALEDPASLATRLHKLVATTLDIDPSETVEEEEFSEEEESDEKESEEKETEDKEDDKEAEAEEEVKTEEKPEPAEEVKTETEPEKHEDL